MIREQATKRAGDALPILDGGKHNAQALYRTELSMSFGDKGRNRDLIYPDGKLRLQTIRATLVTMVRQSRIERDRADNVDLAVALENYLGGTRKLVTRAVGSDKVTLGELHQSNADEREGALVNDSIIKTYLKGELEPLSAEEVAAATVTKEQKAVLG